MAHIKEMLSQEAIPLKRTECLNEFTRNKTFHLNMQTEHLKTMVQVLSKHTFDY